MLKHYPEVVLTFACDGVIAPSALGNAARAAQLEEAARRRAGALLATIPGQAELALRQARVAGHAQGYSDAILAVAPQLNALVADAQGLRNRLRERLREVLVHSLEAEGVVAELLVRRCERALAEADEVVLYIPNADNELADRVRDGLAGLAKGRHVALHRSDLPHPLLKAGPLTVELDPAGPLLGAIESIVDEDALQAAAQQRAQNYANSLTSFLRQFAARAVPSSPEETDDR